MRLPSPLVPHGRRPFHAGMLRAAVAASVLVCLAATAACGSSAGGNSSPTPGAPGSSASGDSSSPMSSSTSPMPSSAPASSPSSAAMGSGPVNVLYAGSLVNLMTKQVGPSFTTSTGYTLDGFSAGSTALASQIKGKVRQGDVFVSASPDADASLMGTANGSWVSWYAKFASSALVIGYNSKSTFAHDLQTKPWYDVITESGFRIGTTDPASDPKGKLAAKGLKAAVKAHPKLQSIISDKNTVFPEETLVGRLQSGQLDAGFFYTSEAKAAGLPTVPLTGQSLKATYTITVLKGAPHQAAAEAFVTYLLGPAGQAVLKQDGFTLISPPKVTGSGLPAGVKSVLSGS